MTFEAFDGWWWPYLFILIAGWLVTDFWRFLGVYFADHIGDDSDVLVLVRATATALVAAVIGNLVVFPTGVLAESSLGLRVGAVFVGLVVYLFLGKRVLLGICVAEGILISGLALSG